MQDSSRRVLFTLFSLSNSDAAKLATPEGTIVLQYLGFPKDVAHATCIPIGPVGIWCKTNVTDLDAQWYQPTERIDKGDIPKVLIGSPKIKDHICHARRPNPAIYRLVSLSVDGKPIQLAAFVGKKVVFSRMGQSVELDLSHVRANQRFTLTLEWSYWHLEIRVTWSEGDGLEKYWSGRGVLDMMNFSPPPKNVGRVVQFKSRTEFHTTLIDPSNTRLLWQDAESSIRDADPTGRPRQEMSALRKIYVDSSDFCESVVNMFIEIQGVLMKCKPTGFWDHDQPKSELDAGASLRMLFESICAYKNIKVFQEDSCRSGDVDFVFTGVNTNCDQVTLLLEIKNAHSNRLETGLTQQLPKYLLERQAQCGVYGVLWFKGRAFDKPQDMTLTACLERLKKIKPSAVNEVVGFDVSFPISASKLS